MAKADHTRRSTLRLVVSEDDGAPAPKRSRARPALRLVVDDRPRLQLLRTMTVVARARALAAERIRIRLAVGRGASIGLVGGLAAVSLAQGFLAGTIAPHGQRLLAILAALAAVSVLLMMRHRADERAIVAAHDLACCAQRIEALAAELHRAAPGDGARVHDIRVRYYETLRACGTGHRHADYRAAQAELGHGPCLGWSHRLRSFGEVYLRETVITAMPLLALIAI